MNKFEIRNSVQAATADVKDGADAASNAYNMPYAATAKAVAKAAAAALKFKTPATGANATAKLLLHYVSGSCVFEKRTIVLEPNVECEIGRSVIGEREPSRTNAFFDCRVLSRFQAAIWLDNFGKFWLQDRKSTNGTFKNGSKLGKAAVELYCGDIVQFGSSVLTTSEKGYFKCVIARIGLVKKTPTPFYESLPVILNKAQMRTFIEFLEMELKNIEEEIFQGPLKNELLNLIDEQLEFHATAKTALSEANTERCKTLQHLDHMQQKLAASQNECKDLRKKIAIMKTKNEVAKERLRLQAMINQECSLERKRKHTHMEKKSQQHIKKLQQQIDVIDHDYQNLCNTIVDIKKKKRIATATATATITKKHTTVQTDDDTFNMEDAEDEGSISENQTTKTTTTTTTTTTTNVQIENETRVEQIKLQPPLIVNHFIEAQHSSSGIDIDESKEFSDCIDDSFIEFNSFEYTKPQQPTAAVQTTTSLLKMSVELFNEIYEDVFTRRRHHVHGHRVRNGSATAVKNLSCLDCNALDLETKSVVRFIIAKIVTMPEHKKITDISDQYHQQKPNKEQRQNNHATAPLQRCYGGHERFVEACSENDLRSRLLPAPLHLKNIANLSLNRQKHLNVDRKILMAQENFCNLSWIPYIITLVTVAYGVIAYIFIMYL